MPARRVDLTVEEFTTPNPVAPDPVTVRTNDPLDEVAYRMSDLKIGSVIVLDEYGSFYGIFTATDALNALIEVVRGDQ